MKILLDKFHYIRLAYISIMEIKLSPQAKLKVLLYEKKTSCAEIARQIGKSPVYVYLVSVGRRRGATVRQAISEILGLDPSFWEEMDRVYKR